LGKRRNAHVVKDVLSEADVILERANEAPEEARAAGILPQDLDALRADRAAAETADNFQEDERAAAPGSTSARNQAAWRIVRAAHRIASAGLLHYVASKTEKATFDALRHLASEHHDNLEAHGD